MQNSASHFLNSLKSIENLSDVTPPENYSPWILAVAIVGAVISIFIFVSISIVIFEFERRKFNEYRKRNKVSRRKLKKIFIELIERIETDYESGELNDDDAFYEISRAIREYASLRTKTNLRTSTLKDVSEKNELVLLASTIEKMYEFEFVDREKVSIEIGNPLDAANLAKNLLKKW